MLEKAESDLIICDKNVLPLIENTGLPILVFDENEDLYLKSHIDGNKHGHMKDIYFTLFKICCDSSVEIGGGC